MDDAAREHIDAIPAEHRPLFDRIDRLVRQLHPDVEVVLSYKMPTFVAGDRRLYVGTWRHGVSLYGWEEGRDGGLLARHPELRSGRGTIRLRPADAAAIGDDDLLALVADVLGP